MNEIQKRKQFFKDLTKVKYPDKNTIKKLIAPKINHVKFEEDNKLTQNTSEIKQIIRQMRKELLQKRAKRIEARAEQAGSVESIPLFVGAFQRTPSQDVEPDSSNNDNNYDTDSNMNFETDDEEPEELDYIETTADVPYKVEQNIRVSLDDRFLWSLYPEQNKGKWVINNQQNMNAAIQRYIGGFRYYDEQQL
jgi:hypothetical protein